MEENFTGYEKMPESLRQLVEDEQTARLLHKAQWVATEKVHGANFCISASAEGLRFGKRKSWLAPEDDFFAWQSIAPLLAEPALRIWKMIRNTEEVERVNIYGELFGGGYPHPAIAPVPGLQPVQTGIWYAPGIHFYAFDIATEAGEERSYMDYRDAITCFEKAGMLFARPLAQGSLSDVMAFNIRQDSFVPGWLGLPPLTGKNIMEGIVIKPLQEVEIPGRKGSARAILKIKNAEFNEEETFHQAQKWSWKPEMMAENVAMMLEEMKALLTQNRLNNAISKAGAPDPADAARMLEIRNLLWEDVWSIFEERHADLLALLSAGERESLEKETAQLITLLMYH